MSSVVAHNPSDDSRRMEDSLVCLVDGDIARRIILDCQPGCHVSIAKCVKTYGPEAHSACHTLWALGLIEFQPVVPGVIPDLIWLSARAEMFAYGTTTARPEIFTVTVHAAESAVREQYLLMRGPSRANHGNFCKQVVPNAPGQTFDKMLYKFKRARRETTVKHVCRFKTKY